MGGLETVLGLALGVGGERQRAATVVVAVDRLRETVIDFVSEVMIGTWQAAEDCSCGLAGVYFLGIGGNSDGQVCAVEAHLPGQVGAAHSVPWG